MSALPIFNEDAHLLDQLIAMAAEELSAGGTEADKCLVLAERITARMQREFGGRQFYFPMGRGWRLTERDYEIYNMCNGTNWEKVAKHYHLSVVRVRQIFSEVRSAERAKRQIKLFPDN